MESVGFNPWCLRRGKKEAAFYTLGMDQLGVEFVEDRLRHLVSDGTLLEIKETAFWSSSREDQPAPWDGGGCPRRITSLGRVMCGSDDAAQGLFPKWEGAPFCGDWLSSVMA